MRVLKKGTPLSNILRIQNIQFVFFSLSNLVGSKQFDDVHSCCHHGIVTIYFTPLLILKTENNKKPKKRKTKKKNKKKEEKKVF
jgi:hypothetical protein